MVDNKIVKRGNQVRNILMLTTGGTIASRPTEDGLAPGDIRPLLYDKMAGLVGKYKVTIRPVFTKDSSNIVPDDWKQLAQAIRENLPNYDGIVILHGTDTMSYSAAMLSYLFMGVDKPIVITGSQLPLEKEGSDGVINLNDAVIVAADPRLAGVFVVFHDKIMNGTRTHKKSSINPDAYISCNYPYVGVVKDEIVYVTADYAEMRRKELEEHEKAADLLARMMASGKKANESIRIFMLKMVPGFDAGLLDYLARENYQGVVIEGFGLGGIPVADEQLTEKLTALIRSGIPVVMATQCVYDGVNLDTYEVGVQANRLGMISASDMTSEAVYTKLMWILSLTDDYSLIREALETNFCGEVRVLK